MAAFCLAAASVPFTFAGQAPDGARDGSGNRSVPAVNYGGRRGSTRLRLTGTSVMPDAAGELRVQVQRGSTRIEARVTDLKNPTALGHEYLTYILWAVSPDGRTFNLGEVPLPGDRNILTALLPGNRTNFTVTTPLQTFALIVTAEPYYAVRAPSDLVVLENEVPLESAAEIQTVEARYNPVQLGGYVPTGFKFDAVLLTTNLPLDFFQARNAVRIAERTGAAKEAGTIYDNAVSQLARAEQLALQPRVDRRALVSASREAVQTAEDARDAAARRAEASRLDEERRVMADREAQARAQALAEEERRRLAEKERASAEADRQAAERLRAEADRANREAQAAAEAARRAQVEAEQRRLTALEQQQAAEAEVERSRAAARELDAQLQQLIKDREELRGRLLQQLNVILETRDTARGLIVNLSDVTFATGEAALQPGARERLARISGILSAHPTLVVEVEGHTDSVGSDAFNQGLSERRADSVRNYLVQQGVPAASITSAGFGKTSPVATNDTAEGRQMNRRVELIVSGEVIGTEAQ
jgi:outer membrane protein OmpA-like peptidoglycan-associated protein